MVSIKFISLLFFEQGFNRKGLVNVSETLSRGHQGKRSILLTSMRGSRLIEREFPYLIHMPEKQFRHRVNTGSLAANHGFEAARARPPQAEPAILTR